MFIYHHFAAESYLNAAYSTQNLMHLRLVHGALSSAGLSSSPFSHPQLAAHKGVTHLRLV